MKTANKGTHVMKELVTVMTRKGQITVPAEVRRKLGLKRGDKIAFILEEGWVRLVPRGSVVAHTAGAFRRKGRGMSARELREAFERAMAKDTVDRSGK